MRRKGAEILDSKVTHDPNLDKVTGIRILPTNWLLRVSSCQFSMG